MKEFEFIDFGFPTYNEVYIENAFLIEKIKI